MTDLFLRVLAVSGVACVLLAPLMLCGPWLERRYAPQTRWGMWVGTSMFLLLALLVTAYEPKIVVEVPTYAVTLPAAAPAQPQQGAAPGEEGAETGAGVAPAARQIPWTDLLAALWLAVAAALLLRQGAAYCLTRRRLLRASVPAEGLEDWGRDLDVTVSFRRLPGLKSPMTLGILRPVVLLPEGEVPSLALRHELLHIKRGDIPNKAFIFLACSVHWFNPLVWLMARTADRDVEAACDAEVIRRSGEDCKKPYGELLLSAAETGGRVPFATRFGGEKEQMRRRLYQLFHPGRQNRPLACVLLLAALLLTVTVACRQAPADDTLYTNETYGFTLQLPESWAGKYTATESGNEVGFFQRNHGDNTGYLCTLRAEDAVTFRTEHEGMTDAEIEDAWPVQMHILGEGGGFIFYVDYVSDVSWDWNNKEILAEYQEMERDARSQITSGAFRYTGQT